MLKALLVIVLCCCSTAVAQQHPYIQPDLAAPKQLAPLPLVDFDKASQPVHKTFSERTDKVFWGLAAAYTAGTVADIVTTQKAINRGGIESNSLFARDGGHRAAIGLNVAVSLIPFGIAYLLQKMGYRWPARVLLTGAASLRWRAAIHNHSILR